MALLFKELRAAAALASGWPVLVVPTAGPEETLRELEEVLGPLPQAELAGDADHQEIWVELPTLAAEDWLAVRERLGEEVELVSGEAPGRRAARDLGVLVDEVVEVDGLRLVHSIDIEQGLSTLPQLVPGRPDPQVLELEHDLDRALTTRGLPRFASDRGPGTVQPMVEPTTGRFGVLLSWGDGPELEPLGTALSAVVEARAEHTTLRIAPDVVVDRRMGLGLVLWIVAPAREVIPWDLAVGGMQPPIEGLAERVSRLGDAARALEIQVLPASSHVDAALAAAEILEGLELPVSPASPRWLVAEDTLRFAPTWAMELSEAPVHDLVGLSQIADHPAIAAVRVLPADPAGLESEWEVVDLGGIATAHGWAVRLRHGVTGRDLLVPVEDREPDTRDDQAEEALLEALGEAEGASWLMEARLTRAVLDATGHHGLELRIDPVEALSTEALGQALAAALGAPVPDASSFASWGRRGGDLVVQLWYAERVVSEQG
ncbi:MAG: hypothetical protein KC912_15350 [Proteobacteria bacterium]|nr:hypothetical protein [Pseudomonadota bacterium]